MGYSEVHRNNSSQKTTYFLQVYKAHHQWVVEEFMKTDGFILKNKIQVILSPHYMQQPDHNSKHNNE